MAEAKQSTNRAGLPLTVNIFWRAGGGAVVEPFGELDLQTVPLVSEALQCVRASGTGPVEIDARHLEFCDVCGLGAVLASYRDLATAGRALFVVRPTPQLRRLISVAQVGYLLHGEPAPAV